MPNTPFAWSRMCSIASADRMLPAFFRSPGLRAACIAALALVACKGDGVPEGDRVVAEAFDERLYWSDLRHRIPVGTPVEDSAAMARRIIDNWARERVVLRKAQENVDASVADIEERLRAYRESLLIYAYEQALVNEKLDTIVSDAEVERHYHENTTNFELKDNILRARWFKLMVDDPKLLKRVDELWKDGREEAWHELEVLLARRNVVINDTREGWIEFRELQHQIPLRPANPTDWLQRNRRVAIKDSTGQHYLEVIEHRLAKSISPLDLVRPSVRAIIINQRKLQLIARMREDLYNEALRKNDIRVP